MAQSAEKTIEGAMVAAISALNYMATNSVSVRADDDMTKTKGSKWVNVACNKAERIAPNYNYYKTDVEIGCITHVPNDESDTVSENMYKAANDYIQALASSVTALNAAVSTAAATDVVITVDGVVPTANEDDYEENMRVNVIRADMYYTYTTSTASAWTPSDITTALWLDASDASTITEDVGVETWADKSGNSRDVTQTTDADQPNYNSTTKAVEFDGVSEYMSGSFGATLSQPTTIIVLFKRNAAVIDAYIYDGIASPSRNALFGAPQWDAYAGVELLGGTINTNLNIIATTYNNTSSEIVLNGTSIATGNTGTHSLTGIALGVRYSLDTAYLNGIINEIIIVNSAVDTATRQKIEGYLAWKWDGINGNTALVTALPSDHPYKSAAPTA